MFRIYIFLIITFLTAFTASAQYRVDCLNDNGNTMTFRAVGYGKNAQKATDDAELSVIKALLFYGVPDTQHSSPLINESEDVAENENRQFFRDFYSGEYKKVITRSVITRQFSKDENKQKSITLDITVSVSALRNTLEKNKVIRKFGL